MFSLETYQSASPVVLGVLIGGLVVAMYMPIFKMGKVVSGGG